MGWKERRTELLFAIVKTVLKEILPWLEEEAKKTETPIDDKIIQMLKKVIE
jgi:hypothetical protein